MLIGLAAGLICFSATQFIKRVLKIDDSLDVFPVHGVGGILGTLLAGVFASTELGVFSGFGFNEAAGITSMGQQLGVQFIGAATTVVYAAVASYIILKLVDALVGLRVTSDQETEGLDIVLHEETGYNNL
jgi:Amt family ammonium transporter